MIFARSHALREGARTDLTVPFGAVPTGGAWTAVPGRHGRVGGMAPPDEVTEFFAGYPLGQSVYEKVCAILDRLGSYEVRVSKSQVAFRRRRGFAYLWRPGQYLAKPAAEVVLSIALGRALHSDRFKEVAHPTSRQWMHHLEIHAMGDLDDEVAGWLREAAQRAGS